MKLGELLDSQGFVIIEQLLDAQQLLGLQQMLVNIETVGLRNLTAKIPAVRELASSSVVRALLEPLLGKDALLVRSIYFNKDGLRNWQVAWHRDTTIAVAARHDLEGFTAWSIKEGMPHAHAPSSVLEKMLTLRLHLDAADADNGALWVAPGSHRLEKIEDEAAVIQQCGARLCAVVAGDALLMRPMLLHASHRSTTRRPRRVVHLEFATPDALPPPLQWVQQPTS